MSLCTALQYKVQGSLLLALRLGILLTPSLLPFLPTLTCKVGCFFGWRSTFNHYSFNFNMHLAKHTPRSDIHPAQLQPGVRFGFESTIGSSKGGGGGGVGAYTREYGTC